MANAVTKQDLDDLGKTLGSAIARLDGKLDDLEAKVATKVDLDATNQEVRRVGLLLENQLMVEAQAALEGTTSARDEILRAMGAMEQRLEGSISMLEEVVREHSEHLQQLGSDVEGLTAEVRELRIRFDRRDDLEALERRVRDIEQRLARPAR